MAPVGHGVPWHARRWLTGALCQPNERGPIGQATSARNLQRPAAPRLGPVQQVHEIAVTPKPYCQSSGGTQGVLGKEGWQPVSRLGSAGPVGQYNVQGGGQPVGKGSSAPSS